MKRRDNCKGEVIIAFLVFALNMRLQTQGLASCNIKERLTWSPGGMMREIMDVPFPLAFCKLLISFLTFQISTFLSEAVSSDIVTYGLWEKVVYLKGQSVMQITNFWGAFLNQRPQEVLIQAFFIQHHLRKQTEKLLSKGWVFSLSFQFCPWIL